MKDVKREGDVQRLGAKKERVVRKRGNVTCIEVLVTTEVFNSSLHDHSFMLRRQFHKTE